MLRIETLSRSAACSIVSSRLGRSDGCSAQAGHSECWSYSLTRTGHWRLRRAWTHSATPPALSPFENSLGRLWPDNGRDLDRPQDWQDPQGWHKGRAPRRLIGAQQSEQTPLASEGASLCFVKRIQSRRGELSSCDVVQTALRRPRARSGQVPLQLDRALRKETKTSCRRMAQGGQDCRASRGRLPIPYRTRLREELLGATEMQRPLRCARGERPCFSVTEGA
jgi:hypothetical protein